MNRNQFYIGPKVNLNAFYLPGHSHIGLSAGYRYFYIESEKFSSFFSLDYQLSYFRLYDPYDYFPKRAKNHIQELVVGMGSQYQFYRDGMSTSVSDLVHTAKNFTPSKIMKPLMIFMV